MRFVVVLVVSMTVPSAQVLAQDTGGGAEPQEDSARARAMPTFNRGIELVGEHRWAEALDAFLEAWEVFESPNILFNIGYCQRALGQYVAALETFDRFLELELSGVAATRTREARGFVRELRGRIAHLTVVVPDGLRDGTDTSVDGRVVEIPSTGGVEMPLDPGRHTVQARRDGFQPFFADRDLRPGERERVTVALEPLPARLRVTSNVDDAEVLLDGESLGDVPLDTEIPPGRHELEVESSGYVPHRAVLDVRTGDVEDVSAHLSEAPTAITERWWFWTGLAVVVAGAATATYFLTRPEPEPPPYDGGSLDWVVGVDM